MWWVRVAPYLLLLPAPPPPLLPQGAARHRHECATACPSPPPPRYCLREQRATDMSVEKCKKRYEIFRQHYSAVLRLKQYFPFHLIDAMGTLDDTRDAVTTELRYGEGCVCVVVCGRGGGMQSPPPQSVVCGRIKDMCGGGSQWEAVVGVGVSTD